MQVATRAFGRALVVAGAIAGGAASQSPALSAQSAGGVVEGSVVTPSGSALEPLASADVMAVQGGRQRTAVTDRQGRFRFDGLSDGTYTIRVLHVGYRPAELDVVLSGGRTVSVEIVVSVLPVELPGVDVVGDPNAPPNVADPGRSDLAGADVGTVGLEALEAGSGMAASGMAALFRGSPGNDPGDPTDVLFMRGSSMDLRLVLLDGAPLYTPFHVSGLLPAFDPAVLNSAQLHNGGPPPEYDGGLSHVLDLRTRSARGGEAGFSGAVDLLSARLGGRVPLGERSGVAFGTRGLHGAAERVFGSGFPYGYEDLIVRADVGLAEQHSLEATGFVNQESVALDFGAIPDANGVRATVPTFPSSAQWGNSAVTVGYAGRGERTAVSLRGAWSAYDAQLPIQSSLPLFAEGRTERRRAVAQVRRSVDGGHVRLGVSADALDLDYTARRLATDVLPEVPEVSSHGRGTAYAAFFDGAQQLSPTLRVEGGLRVASYLGDGARLAPRASLTWLFGENAALAIRAGRSHQLTTETDQGVAEALAVESLADPEVDGSTALAPPAAALLSVASASHVVVSLDQFVSDQTRLGLDGWFRRYAGLGASRPDELNGSGIDMRIVRSGSSVEGWFGYSLSWYWSPEIGAPEPFQGRQLLSAGLAGRVASGGRANLQLSFGDGLPFTAVRLEDAVAAPGLDAPPDRQERNFGSVTELSQGNPPLAGGPSGDFLRLDAEVSWSIDRTVGSRAMEFRPYVRVLNALNRRDALFYFFEAWRDADARPLAELSLMPIIGLSWHF